MKFIEEDIAIRYESIKQQLNKLKREMTSIIDETNKNCKNGIRNAENQANTNFSVWGRLISFKNVQISSKKMFKSDLGFVRLLCRKYTRSK